MRSRSLAVASIVLGIAFLIPEQADARGRFGGGGRGGGAAA